MYACMIACSTSSIVCNELYTGSYRLCIDLLYLVAIECYYTCVEFESFCAELVTATPGAPCVTSYADCVLVLLGLHAACSCSRRSRAALSFDGCLFEHIGAALAHAARAQQLSLAL